MTQAPPTPDVELITLCAEFEATERELSASNGDHAADIETRASAAATGMVTIPARTLQGLFAKLRVLACDADITEGVDWTADLIRSCAADAERLAGEVAP